MIKITNDMSKMDQDTILHFYMILENSLLESDISKINEADIDAWSQSFKKVVRESKEKSGKGIRPFFNVEVGRDKPCRGKQIPS